MADQFDPTMRMHHDETQGGEQAGMDPEGLMPADESLHGDEAAEAGRSSDAPDSTDSIVPARPDTSAASQLPAEPHDQPAEGGVEQAEDRGSWQEGRH
jgi:hypothetical protein